MYDFFPSRSTAKLKGDTTIQHNLYDITTVKLFGLYLDKKISGMNKQASKKLFIPSYQDYI